MNESKEPDSGNSPGGLQEFIRKVTSTFAIPPDEKIFSPLAEAVTRVSQPFRDIGAAFRTNLTGMISSISMPLTLADRSMQEKHWQRFLLAARIRSRMLDSRTDETPEQLERRRNEQALANARIEMDNFLNSPESEDLRIGDTLEFLDNLQPNEALIEAANELMLQGAVLCWGAFEVTARDCFVAHLNANPTRSLALMGDPVARRRFDLSKVSLETLAAHNFDLSERMGTLLSSQQDLSDVRSVKAVYQALFPDQKDLVDAQSDSNLRLLSLRRNLIVHRRGIIDEHYAASASGCQPIGERLKLSPRELEDHLSTAIRVASVLLEVASVP